VWSGCFWGESVSSWPGPARAESILSFADRVIAKGSLVKTDGARYFYRLPSAGYEHQAFVGVDNLAPAQVSLPGVHMVSSLLKR
jgi:hypothetical protein